jgi:hypothetical protein
MQLRVRRCRSNPNANLIDAEPRAGLCVTDRVGFRGEHRLDAWRFERSPARLAFEIM